MKYFLYILVFLLFTACADEQPKLVIFGDEQSSDSLDNNPDLSETADSAERKTAVMINPDDMITIMVRADGAPGMYLGDDGDVHGFYIDLTKMIMSEMQQNYRFQAYTDLGPVIHGIKAGTMQIALTAPDVPDYKALAHLTVPFETHRVVTFRRSGDTSIGGATAEDVIESFKGKKIGVQTRAHVYQALREEKEIELVEFPTSTLAMEALDRGDVDAVPDVKRVGIYYANSKGWNIEAAGAPILELNICNAVSRAIDESFLVKYNNAISKVINDGRLKKLYEDYFSIAYEKP